jgi:cell division inhibitor SepF
MGVFDKFKDLVGIEEYDEDDYLEEDVRPVVSQMERQRVEPRNVEPRNNYSQRTRDKVLSMQKEVDAMKMVVTEPAGFEECPKLVDSLKARKPVIINLEKIDSDTARKIFDFLSGATYALNGTVQKVANNIFVFAPENIDISANAPDTKGFDFSKDNDSWR